MPRPRPLPCPRPLAVPAILLLLSLGACAGMPRGGPAGAAAAGGNDPLETVNRRVLDVNLALDGAVFRRVAQFYRDNVSAYGRARVHAFMANLNEPQVFANDLLQFRLLDAAGTLGRFGLNTTAGLAGLYDVATPNGLPRRTGDFGQTLARLGVPDGPYLMVPVAGPSNPRDLVGTVVDGFFNPVTYALPFSAGVARGVVEGVALREANLETLDALRADSLDFYARLRSVSRQRRDAELGRSVEAGADAEAPAALDDPGAPRVLDDPGARAPR